MMDSHFLCNRPYNTTYLHWVHLVLNLMVRTLVRLCVISQSLGSHVMTSRGYIVLTDHCGQSSPSSGCDPGSLKEDKTRQTHYFFSLYNIYSQTPLLASPLLA